MNMIIMANGLASMKLDLMIVILIKDKTIF
jgi:hypothetical protein